MTITFEGEVSVIDWKTNAVIARLDAVRAFCVMSRSVRFDNSHAMASVRVLHFKDADELATSETQREELLSAPVIFQCSGTLPVVRRFGDAVPAFKH